MRTSWRPELAQLAIVAGMLVASAAVWPIAPESMPVHFDLTGQPDRYGSKAEALLAMPLVALVSYALLRFLPALDPARANYRSFASAYLAIRSVVLLVFAVIHAALLLPVAGVAIDQGAMIHVVVGGLLVALGVVMGKLRPNWFVGVRTPWTLASKTSWVKTHRLAGWVFIAAGLVWLATIPLERAAGVVIALGVMGVGIVWTVVYSYLIWRADPDRFPAISTRPADDAGGA